MTGWPSLIEVWVAVGLQPADFWAVTPREAEAIFKGAQARDGAALRQAQALAYSHAVLIAHGYHNPKRMPSFDQAFPGLEVKAPETTDQMMAAMMQWTAVLGRAERNNS